MAREIAVDAVAIEAVLDRLTLVAQGLEALEVRGGSTEELGSDDVAIAVLAIALAFRRRRDELGAELTALRRSADVIVDELIAADAALASEQR